MSNLTQRQQTILMRVVDEFATTGEPVSSGSIARDRRVQLSSATVRAVMAELEELGLLYQPHVSAGRVPTPAGTRCYVNHLYARHAQLGAAHRQALDEEFGGLGDRVEVAAQRAGELLSRLSSLTSIVSLIGLHHVRLNDVKLSLLGDRRILAILVAQDARVFHRVLRLDEPIDAPRLAQVQAYLSELVHQRTLAEARALVNDARRIAQAKYLDYMRAALEIGRQALLESPGPQVHIEGTLHILEQREFNADLDRLRELLSALEEKERVLALLDKVCEARGSQVLIGPELGWDLGDDLSLIVCDYYRGEQHMGVVGVLGPIRMDYARVIPLVDWAASMLSRTLVASD